MQLRVGCTGLPMISAVLQPPPAGLQIKPSPEGWTALTGNVEMQTSEKTQNTLSIVSI